MQSIINAIPAPVFVKNREGLYVACNEHFAQFVGRTSEEIVGESVFDLWDKDLAQIYFDADEDLMHRGGNQQYISRVKNNSGQIKHVKFHKAVFRSQELGLSGIFGVIFDITESIERENILEHARADAEEASKLKSQFVAIMSHDIRTPLNSILGFSELIQSASFGMEWNEEYERCASNIHKSGSFILNLVNNFLDLEKIKSGKYNLIKEECDIRDIVQESVSQLDYMAIQSDISIETCIDVEAHLFFLDRRVCIQILNNLLSNALKFTAAKGVVRISANVDNDRRLDIRVADNGIGMTKEGVAQAFERFSQADQPLAFGEPHRGTGLGVPLCVDFMKMMGGGLTIDSTPGEGTTVRLLFPPSLTVSRA